MARNLEDLPSREPINLEKVLGCRPYCNCCAGGDLRKRPGKYSRTKAASHSKNHSNLRAKPRSKDHR